MKIVLTLSFLVISLNNICAQWSNTTNQFYDSLHMPVCTEVGVQENPVVLQSFPDGGYFVIWEDRRDGFYSKTKIYAQKYDNKGKRLWAVNGVPVSAGTNNQHYTYASNVDYRNYSVAATDSAGGFYMCYADDSVTNYVWERVMVQHVRNNGNVVFPGAGYIRFSSTTANLHVAPQLIADGNKGFFIGFIHNVSQATNVYVDCFKDENGVMKYYGGSLMNQNAILVNNPPCNNHTISYPGTTVSDYKIYPDLQKGCNIVMSMAQNAGGNDRTFTGYNWLWRVKKDSRVGGSTIFYPKDSVVKFYEVVIRTEYPFQCGNAIYTGYFLESNGFLQVSNLAYGVEKAKGTVVATDGNINANIIAVNEREYINNSVTDWFTRILYLFKSNFMKQTLFIFCISLLIIPFTGCDNGIQSEAEKQANHIQKTMKENTPGAIATSEIGYYMKAKIDGKDWSASHMVPDNDERSSYKMIRGENDGDNINFQLGNKVLK